MSVRDGTVASAGGGEESAGNNWAASHGDDCMGLAMGEPPRFLPGLRSCDLKQLLVGVPGPEITS